MLKRLLLLFFLIISSSSLLSQEPDSLRVGIHQVQNEFYASQPPENYQLPIKDTKIPSGYKPSATRTLRRKVLGWHPYWASSSAYLSYDYSALSHIAYFSYEVDTATGGYSTIHDWNTTPIINYAHQKGTRVLLTVTNFGSSGNTKILSDTIKQKVLISTLISLLKSRNGDGVNFDLESVNSSQRLNLVKFITRAVSLIKAELPVSEISLATPAVDWSGSWDIKALSEICDYMIVMGYDYYWSGSPTAGPVAPLEGETYNVSRTVNTYMNTGVNSEKLLLGVPWYGYDWPVVSNFRKAGATGSATARIYSAAKLLASKEYVTLKIFDLFGKEREVLVNGELDAGYHSEEFNSIGYGQGLYLCVLQTKKIKSTQTIMVIH